MQCSDTLSVHVTHTPGECQRGRGTGLTLPESVSQYVRVYTASVRLIYRGKVQCSDTLRTGSDETRQDHPDEIEVRSDRMGSCQVRSGQVHPMLCVLSSPLHYIQCIMYQCRERVQHCMVARPDEIRPNQTGPIPWKSSQVGSGQVRSGEVGRSNMYRYVRAYTAS